MLTDLLSAEAAQPATQREKVPCRPHLGTSSKNLEVQYGEGALPGELDPWNSHPLYTLVRCAEWGGVDVIKDFLRFYVTPCLLTICINLAVWAEQHFKSRRSWQGRAGMTLYSSSARGTRLPAFQTAVVCGKVATGTTSVVSKTVNTLTCDAERGPPCAAKLLLENGADASMRWQPGLATVHTQGHHLNGIPRTVFGCNTDYEDHEMPSFQGLLFCVTRVVSLAGRYQLKRAQASRRSSCRWRTTK